MLKEVQALSSSPVVGASQRRMLIESTATDKVVFWLDRYEKWDGDGIKVFGIVCVRVSSLFIQTNERTKMGNVVCKYIFCLVLFTFHLFARGVR